MKIAAAAVALLAVAGTARAAEPGWKPLSWLVGEWKGEGGGAQIGQGGFSFEPDAGGQVLVRRNFAAYPAQNGKPASRHDDLMVIAGEGGQLRATYWDSEGQTIHYAVSAASPDEVVFVSDDAAGPRFRLSYRKTANGLAGRFEIAPPTARDRFSDYLAWTAVKAR